ncbi:transcription factor bHLH112-like isoform X2 [Magnolia sinica]|uniref:transcription factor bHLH112-like isoform X2 n=1 Tax=Magnolia sinica TaxID=86752 RepID=UPI00265B4607|nr:transcription factor bHLH112-like isoform X2 [Magnolia sinica]
MAEDFQAWICSENWWNSTRNGFSNCLSPCSKAVKDFRSFEWSRSDVDEMKERSCGELASASNSSIVTEVSDSINGGSMLMDSTLQMMGCGLPSPTIDWNQALLSTSCRAESNTHSDFQALSSTLDLEMAMKPTSFSGGSEDPSSDQQRLDFYGRLQGLFEPDLQPQQPTYDNRSTNCSSPIIHGMNSNEISNSRHEQHQFFRNPSPKQQSTNLVHFSNNATFLNTTAAAINTIQPSSYYPSSQAQYRTPNFETKPNRSNLPVKPNPEVCDWGSTTKKSGSEPAPKKPRIGTPSPLPTFKVRKEKLGDRITALQQLVSPFGKVLTTPYMKNDVPIQHQQNFDKLNGSDGPKQDLRSRGLCLVPTTSTFSVTNEFGTDFSTPMFGGISQF